MLSSSSTRPPSSWRWSKRSCATLRLALWHYGLAVTGCDSSSSTGRRRHKLVPARRILRPARGPLRGLDSLEADVVAANPARRLAQGLGHGFGRGGPVERDLAGDQGLAFPGRIGPPGQAAAGEQRHGVVAVHPLGLRYVG